jgi:glycosyltransferase involved in cell wall biosynthesis
VLTRSGYLALTRSGHGGSAIDSEPEANSHIDEAPLVSVCVINYNYARYVGTAIESALAQVGVEVIVVDDGSTDDSRDVIARYDDRTTVCVKANGGQASAMNAALAASMGDIVLFLDADDELLSGAVDRVVAAFAEPVDGLPVAKVQWRLEVIDADGVATGELRIPLHWPLPSGDLSGHVRKHRTWVWPPTSGGAYSRRALDLIGPVPEAAYRVEADRYLSQFIPFCGAIVSIDEALGRYRIHGANQYAGRTVDAAFFRRKIEQTVNDHASVAEFARARGFELPADVLAPRDASFLGYRLASLRLDPARHPIATDGRLGLMWRGVVAALTNPMHPWRHRVKRAGWFVAAAALPRRSAPSMVRALYD